MNERVDLQLPDQLADDGKTRVRMDKVHPLERAYWVGDVAPEQVRNLGRQPSRYLGAQRIGHARDKYALGSHRLLQSSGVERKPGLSRASPDNPLRLRTT